MTSISVGTTGFGIVVAEDGDAEATTLLEGLPPLRAARYLTATPALRDALREADAEVVEAVRPHLDGAVVVPEAGLAREGADGREPESTRLAQALGVSVIAPEGRFIRCDGTLFSLGGGDGWIAQSPLGARVRTGRRYPAPRWQAQLPQTLPGLAHIPAGLWLTSGSEARHAVRLAGIAVRERQLLVVVGSPGERAPSHERILAALRALPAETRSAVVLAGFGHESLPLETVQALAAELGEPLRVAHGVEIDGEPVRIDGDDSTPPAAIALESVCAPDGAVTLERWATPPGLVATAAAEYRLGETRRARGRAGDRWVVDVVAAGIVVRRADAPPADATARDAPDGSLGIFLQCDDASRPEALPALLAPLRERLEQRTAVTILPIDAAARRVVRDAYPGHWAPTETLAITADGRLVAAYEDASGDTDPAEAPAVDDVVTDVEEAVDASVGTVDGEIALDDQVAPDDRVALDDEEVASPPLAAEADEPVATHPPTRAPGHPTSAPVTVEAVIGGAAASDEFEERSAPATRRDRRTRVTNVPSVDEGAAAWYAAAVARPAAPSVSDEPSPASTPRAETPAPPAPAAKAAQAAPAASSAPATSAASAAPKAATPAATRTPSARPAAAEPASARPAAAPAAPAATAAAAQAPSADTGAASDALARALQGSTSARLLGGASRGSAPTPSAPAPVEPAATADADAAALATHADAQATAPSIASTTIAAQPSTASDAAASEPASQATPAAAVADDEAAAVAADAAAPVATRTRQPIDVPADARSTSEQRHRVRTALGARYDVASRTVSQLLAQQPGMRVAANDRSAMLTGLSLVRVFATEPHADYDLDFHTCLAEGLAMLPTARSVVVRGIPAAFDATPGATLRLPAPLVAAAAVGPAAGPAEALIWTTSGRRLDRVLHGTPGAADVVLPAGARLCVLGTAEGPAPRLLLAEEGADPEQALARLQAAADARGALGTHADDRWLGDLPLAA